MAGDWLKIEVCLPDKPEVWYMHESTGIDPDAIVGKLIRVWAWFDSQTEDGNACFVSEALIDKLAGAPGFAAAMRSAGWLEVDGPEIRLPNFARHNGKTAKDRALTAKRVAQHKARTNAKGNDHGNEEVTIDALPREEKRREENKEQKQESPRKRGKTSKVSMPEDFGISDRVRAWATEKGHQRLAEHLDSFKRKCAANGYRYVDWDAAFMEAIRGDWAKLANGHGNGHGTGAPSAVQMKTVKEAMKPSETPLERDIARARHDCHLGIIDTAERDRRIVEATQRYRRMV